VASGATLSYTGNLGTPEIAIEQLFVLSAISNVQIVTWGFGGGVNAEGTVIPAGGFDPLVALFNSAGAIVTDGSGNPVAGADTLSNFVGNCPPAGLVTIGTGTGSAVCGDVSIQANNLAPGAYIFTLSDANYVPNAVNPGPPSSTNLTDGFTDLTGGVFQTCNVTSDGVFCITPTNNYAADVIITPAGTTTSAPEPGTIGLLSIGAAVLYYSNKNQRGIK
jgi:hypothetical protein